MKIVSVTEIYIVSQIINKCSFTIFSSFSKFNINWSYNIFIWQIIEIIFIIQIIEI